MRGRNRGPNFSPNLEETGAFFSINKKKQKKKHSRDDRREGGTSLREKKTYRKEDGSEGKRSFSYKEKGSVTLEENGRRGRSEIRHETQGPICLPHARRDSDAIERKIETVSKKKPGKEPLRFLEGNCLIPVSEGGAPNPQEAMGRKS